MPTLSEVPGLNFHTDYPADDMDDAMAYGELKKKQLEKLNGIKLADTQWVVEDTERGRTVKFTWAVA